MHSLAVFFSLIPFYLLGAFPTGHLVARTHNLKIESAGSGNVGAANLLRTLGWKAGLLTLGGDAVKGVLAVLLAQLVTDLEYYPALAGLAAVFGHCFSIPGIFKGGKGVATAFGVFLVLSPWAVFAVFAAYAFMLMVFRIASLASLTATLLLPLVSLFLEVPDSDLYCMAAAALLITLRHRSNLKRLIEGKEARLWG